MVLLGQMGLQNGVTHPPSPGSSVGVLATTPSLHSDWQEHWQLWGQVEKERYEVLGPFPPVEKDVGGFRSEKLFSYHLQTVIKCFSKASLRATTTSRAIPAFPWLALASRGWRAGPPCPSRSGELAQGLTDRTCS